MARGKDGKRQVSPESVYNTRMRHIQAKHGPFVNEGKPWSDEDIDLLLEGFLVLSWRFDAQLGMNCFANRLWRSHEGIKCKLYKLAVRHPQGGGDDYTPQRRTTSEPMPLSPQEYSFVELAVSLEGRNNGAHYPEYMAKMLNWNPVSLRAWLKDTRERAPLMIKTQFINEDLDTWNARIVDEVFRKAPHALEDLL